MERETLKQWMSDAKLNGSEDSDGFFIVSRNNLEFSIAYLEGEDLVVCFSSILELEGLEDAQRLEILSLALSLNGVGNLPPCCALSYDEEGDVVYLLWQQQPELLDATRFANAFADFETAALQAQNYLKGQLSGEEGGGTGNYDTQDFVIKV